jgi:hypothetical protein
MVSELTTAPLVAEAKEGRAHVWNAARGLVFTRVEGRMVMAHAQLIMDAVDVAVRALPREAAVIHDFTGIQSYEIAVHASMSAWAIGVVGSLRRIVIGVNSPLVSLAVRTVNLASGNRFELLSTRDQVIEVARKELGARRGLNAAR